MKVFIDTNVFDDLLRGGSSSDDTAFILEFVKRKKIEGCTSAKTIVDIYYLVHSEQGANRANKVIRRIYSIVNFTEQGTSEVKEALSLGWSDFEDAMQMVSAINYGADKIITLDRKFRNKNREFIWSPADLKSYLVQNEIH